MNLIVKDKWIFLDGHFGKDGNDSALKKGKNKSGGVCFYQNEIKSILQPLRFFFLSFYHCWWDANLYTKFHTGSTQFNLQLEFTQKWPPLTWPQYLLFLLWKVSRDFFWVSNFFNFEFWKSVQWSVHYYLGLVTNYCDIHLRLNYERELFWQRPVALSVGIKPVDGCSSGCCVALEKRSGW